MNQTQIAHYKNKLATVLRNAEDNIQKSFIPEELSNEQKVSQIVNGKARFKVERFSDNNCPYGMKDLFTFYEFDGESEMIARNNETHRRLKKLKKQAAVDISRIETQFVLERLEDPVKAIDDFVERYTFDED